MNVQKGVLEWLEKPDADTIACAYITVCMFFQDKVTVEQFNCAVKNASCHIVTVTEYMALNPENAGLENPNRFSAVTIEDAYPDKPRGDKDVETLRYFTGKGIKTVSPIIVTRMTDGSLFKLDGVHRTLQQNFWGYLFI